MIFGLLVEVHDKATVAAFLADGGDEPAKVSLADAALEIERSNHAGAAVGRGWHGLIVPSSGRKSRIVYRRGNPRLPNSGRSLWWLGPLGYSINFHPCI